jgi:hypothetical protein
VKTRHGEIIELERSSEIARQERANDLVRNSGQYINNAQLTMYGVILESGDLARRSESAYLACGIAQSGIASTYRFSDIAAIYPAEQCLRDAADLVVKITAERMRLEQLVRSERAAVAASTRAARERANVEAERARLAEAEKNERLAADAERAKLAAEVERKRKAIEAERLRISDLQSGRVPPKTFQDWLLVTNSPNGNSLASRPLLAPNNGVYAVAGDIESANGTSELLIQVGSYGGYVTYAYAELPRSMANQFPKSARIGSHVWIVGRYIRNVDTRASNGVTRVTPVFRVERIELVE